MLVFETVKKIRNYVRDAKALQKKVGFVPTMGALHEGHLSLVDASLKDNDITICSIYVNPAQFNNPEDLSKYPQNREKDLKMLKKAGCDVVFMPPNEEMYPQEPTIKISFGIIGQALEGKFRSGHFEGVGLVVSKLFNSVAPDKAYFGQKDLQQFYVVKKLVEELSFPVNLIRVPIKREKNGLAMSSRNERLTSGEREKAALLYQSLLKGKELLLSGQTIVDVRDVIKKAFEDEPVMALEYFEVVETKHFQPVKGIDPHTETALCIAANVGKVRLIDNLLLFS